MAAGILGQAQAPPGSILGAPVRSILGGRPSFATMYPTVGMDTPPLPSASTPWYGEQPGIIAKLLLGARDTLMQANQAMPWGGNDPRAIGLDPQAGTIDPSVMVPFATEMAGMATTGSLAAPGVQGGVGMGIRAYHGSPHDFDRFSMEKIGTGEGAQAYGHGLYFAENEGVANSYKKALGGGRNEITDPSTGARKALDYDQWHDTLPGILAQIDPKVGVFGQRWIKDAMVDSAQHGGSPLEAFDRAAAAHMDRMVAQRQPENILRYEQASIARARAAMERLDPKPVNVGSMYEVDINASPDEFLDWDKPLSEQPAKVQAALGVTPEIRRALTDHLQSGRKKTDYDPETWRLMRLADDDPMGSTLAGNQPETAEALRSAGIKGIRYRDAGSRGNAEGGTHNYVVFDDNIIDILKKYGIAGLMAGGAGAAALGSPDPASASAPTYSTGGRF